MTLPILLEIANLEIDAKIGKDRHFIAANRKNKYRIYLGLFSVIGTAVIASKAIQEIFKAVPLISSYESIFISTVSLSVGISTAILGFLGLEKQVTQHRIVGNMYIEIARKARRLINKIHEGTPYDEITPEFEKLLDNYLNVNKEGESSPTSEQDAKSSLKLNFDTHSKIKYAIKLRDSKSMNIEQRHKPTPSLITLIKMEFRIKMAHLFCFLGLISKQTKETYISRAKEE